MLSAQPQETLLVTFSCATGDVFETGSVAPNVTTVPGLRLNYTASQAGNNTLAINTNSAVNQTIYSTGSSIDFYCADDGVWGLKVAIIRGGATTDVTFYRVFNFQRLN